MDPNLIPTIGGGVLFVGVWASVIIGRAYVRRLRAVEGKEIEKDQLDRLG